MEQMSAVASLVSVPTERRAEKRVNQCFKIEFSVLSGNAALGAFAALEQRNAEAPSQAPQADKIPAWAENLSFGGLGITGDLDLLKESGLEKDSFLEMQMEIPMTTRKLRCVGSVAWVKQDPFTGSFRAGVAFLGIDQEDLALVRGAILRLSAPWRWS